jgi:hypothetical protein
MTQRKKAPRPGNLDAKTEQIGGSKLTVSDRPSKSNPARQLVQCRDDVLLYGLAQGKARSYEVVSPMGECWRFSLRYQAESKWARMLAKTGRGAR